MNIRNHFQQMKKNQKDSSADNRLYLKTFYARIQERLQNYFSNLENRIKHDPTLEAEDFVFIQKVNVLLAENLGNVQFKVKELSQALNISSSYLFRKLSIIVGTTPGKYIRLYRLYKAKGFLENSKKTVGSIAYETGFADQSHFSRAFRKVFDCSPQQYREKYLAQNSQNFGEN